MRKYLANAFSITFFFIFTLIVAEVTVASFVKSIFAVLSVPIFLGCFFLIYIMFSRKKHLMQRHIPYAPVILSCMFVLQIVSGYYLQIEGGLWDFGAVNHSAMLLVYGEPINTTYFATYPNNIFLLIILYLYYSVINLFFGEILLMHGIVLNILVLDGTVLLLYATARIIWTESSAKWLLLICALFVPFYVWTPIFYTDTFGMLFLMLFTYLFISGIQESKNERKKCSYYIGAGIILALGIQMKGSIAIAGVASILYLMLLHPIRKSIRYAAILIICSFLALSAYSCLIHIRSIVSQEELDEYQFPYTHWIMMGLNGQGNYNSEDVTFTRESGNFDDKRAATIAEIRVRMSDLKWSGLLLYMNNKAKTYAWNYGTFYAERYLGDFGDMPIYKNGLHEVILTKGIYSKHYYVYTQRFWLSLLLLAIVSIARGFFQKKMKCNSFFHIALFGTMLFFMIWETHPRYILHYSPYVLLAAVDGIHSLFLCSRISAKKPYS